MTTNNYKINNYFFHLTPDIVIKAIEKGGLSPTGHCMALNSYENRVYDLKLDDGSHVISKFYRPGRWTSEQILEEHAFLLELQSDEIPVCAPMYFPDGKTLHEIDGIFYALWPRTGGRAPDELTDEVVQILGRLLARIHNMGAAKEAEKRTDLTGQHYGLESLEFLEQNNLLPEHCKVRYSNSVNKIVEIYESIRKDIPFHRIHGDCHLGNLLNGKDGWFFLDFDDFLTGPAVQDIWMLVPARDQEGLRQRNIFIEAYRVFRDFDSSWLRLVEPLRALRYIRYAGWIAKRWDDPAFPAAFPHFGTVDYWEKETSDLEDQVEFIYENSNKDLPSNLQRAEDEKQDESELSNKDFFWDWEEEKKA
jgi:Ser/Thr protein kinase RdoA (MazF antagonist)